MEREFHQWLKSRLSPSSRVKIGVGDDAAVLNSLGDPGIVVTTDTIAEGTHFQIEKPKRDLPRIGRKALAVNLSDIAAMGARPIAAVVSFLLPQSFRLVDAQRIFDGCELLAKEFCIDIVGGDTNSWNGPLVLGATVIGVEATYGGESCTWQMQTANAGDQILVTGEFGGSILGKHLDFLPQVELANHVAARYQISAATDISDSLSLDLAAIAAASNLGVELFADKIPISSAARQVAAKDGTPALVHALSDGEDFELVLAVSPGELGRLQTDSVVKDKLTLVGRFVPGNCFDLLSDDERKPFEPQGYSH